MEQCRSESATLDVREHAVLCSGILIPDILQPDIHWESDDTINYLKPPVLGEPSGFTLESQDEVVVGRRGQAVWREELLDLPWKQN
ncbi:uncharacterized protein LOC142072580 isoform X2 [Caretta caretta]|uniref:uncharacterized protein LOC142072580 isoform X2 n=1 Tax=Caretta caretta TaxID=8467 RepID=UPI003F4C4E4E